MLGALGGALMGGVAAIRGAREGARTTAEGIRQQVRDQAAFEHESWLREQRQVAYTAFIGELQKTFKVAREAADSLRDPDLERMERAVESLFQAGNLITLIGPPSLDFVATEASRAAGRLLSKIREVERAPEDEDLLERLGAEMDDAGQQLHDLDRQFVLLARQTLRAE